MVAQTLTFSHDIDGALTYSVCYRKLSAYGPTHMVPEEARHFQTSNSLKHRGSASLGLRVTQTITNNMI